MLKDNRVGKKFWGEKKQRFAVMLTQTIADKIDETATELGLTRSEVVERLARSHSFDTDVLKNIQNNNIAIAK